MRNVGISEYIDRYLERNGITIWSGNVVRKYADAVAEDESVFDSDVMNDVSAAISGSSSGHTKYFPLLKGLIS